VELEIKMSALPEEPLQERSVLLLAEALLGLQGAPQQLLLEAHYHDDSEGLLRTAGWALRARREGAELVATAKGPEQDRHGVAARPEINAVIEQLPGPGEPLPGSLVAALLEAGLSIDYWPGVQWVTEIKRTFVDVGLPGGGTAELAIDHGRVYSGKRSHPVCELELELRSGQAAELSNAARKLSEQLLVRPGGRSKAARGLQLLGRLQRPTAAANSDLPTAWRHLCELEEWLREGHLDLSSDYLAAAHSLLDALHIAAPQHLDGSERPLREAIDSAEHARLLWRIFSAVHEP